MENLTINHPRLKVHVRTGSEGPRHDPYSYTEISVTTPKGTTVLHEGLGTWLKHNGYEYRQHKRYAGKYEQWEKWLRSIKFPALVGFTIEQLERIHRRRTSRCPKCGCKDTHWVAGYPGEYLEICSDCGHVVDGCFDRSAVE